MRPTIALGELLERFRVPPNAKVKLRRFDSRWTGDSRVAKQRQKQSAKSLLTHDVTSLAEAQELLKRLKDPRKHWKFSPADMAQRVRWDDYQRAYESLLSATSTKWAPWYVIPADHKWVSRALVAAILIDAITSLDLRYPEQTTEQKRQIAAAKKELAGKLRPAK